MEKSNLSFNLFKPLFGIGLCFIFILLGVWLYAVKAENQTAIAPWIIKGVGIINIVFFGTFFILSLKKLLSRK